MEIVAAIEDKFGLNIPDDALREVNTVADVAAAIDVRLEREGRLKG
jgi:acyl carrier protein